MRTLFCALCLLSTLPLRAAVGDPQIKTDHPWYPGELSCSTFDRLFKTQAALYQRVTGRTVDTDEDKALASWYWRNLNYAHAEEGKCDLFGTGFQKTDWNREYWGALFGHGFGLCGTTHSQYNAEIEALLGHCRSRDVGVAGHNSFEVFLTGGAYGPGKWVLLDHDISTVIFAPDGSRLLGIDEIKAQLKTLTNPTFKPDRQRGWRVAGLHDDDAAGVYSDYNTAEYLAGYAGPPPTVHLRAGESLRRYLKPGLSIGDAYVFWGMNYNTGGIPGPTRDRSWVNQPENMFKSKKGTGYKAGQVRFANAAYTYTPRFDDGTYKQGVVSEDDKHVTFEFRSPYVIAATPPNDKKWGIYDDGGTNGLTITGQGMLRDQLAISVSVDEGKTWKRAKVGRGATSMMKNGVHGPETDRADATDIVKGHNQYLLRFDAPADKLKAYGITITTICQTNTATIPHLHDGTNKITFESTGVAIASAGPTLPQADAHVVDGKMNSPSVTLELTAPRGEKAVRLYGASWQSSGAPPAPVKYQIDYSTDAGKTWSPVVKDWQVTRRQPEPKDFWSQSFAWGDVELKDVTGPVRVRFTNDGRKPYRKVEAHLAYRVSNPTATDVTFNWTNAAGQPRTATHTYAAPNANQPDNSWSFDAGPKVETQWVEFTAK